MATAEEYASWIVKNQAKKGTPEFNIVAKAYEEAKQDEVRALEIQSGGAESVLYEQQKSLPKVLGQSAIKGVANIGDVIVGAPQNYINLYRYLKGKIQGEDVNVPRGVTPVTTQLQRANVITPENEPNTPLLRIADVGTQMMVGGGVLNPRSLTQANQYLPSFAQAMGGSTALEFARQSGVDNPLAQSLITAGGAAAAGAPSFIRSTPSEVARQSLRGVTPQDLRIAEGLQRRSYQMGAPLTGAEAIAQTVGQTPLQATQRVLENAPQSSAVMAQFLRERPAQTRQLVESTLGQISPRQATSQTPIRLQQAGEQLIEGAEKSLTKNIDPYYQQAGKFGVYPTPSVLANDRISEAVDAVTKTAKYGVKDASPNSLKTLIAAKKYLDDEYAAQTSAVSGLQRGASGITEQARAELSNYLKQISPEYAKGAKKYEIAQETQIQPLKRGAVGVIAKTEGTPEQLMRTQEAVLMPQTPKALQPSDIKRTVELLRRKDPTVVADWTKQNLQSIFDETSQKLVGGENQFGGPKFAATIQGNKQQKANLQALIQESAGMQAYQGFERMLDVLEAQGKRQPVGSATAYNQQIMESLREGGIGGYAKAAVSPSALRTQYEQFRLGKNAELLAKILTDKDSIKKLEDLARTKPNSAKSQALVNTIVGGYVGQKPELTAQEEQ
jgi:hypothetical protein